MPDYAVKKLEATFLRVVASGRFKKFLSDSMIQPAWIPADEYGKHLAVENDQWKTRLSELDLLKK
jgi:tripartite-type tricarboxylate transporter receptor subunit TctC